MMKEYALPRGVQARADAALGALMRSEQRARNRARIREQRFAELAFEIGLVRAESLLIGLAQRQRASKLVRPAVGRWRSSRRR